MPRVSLPSRSTTGTTANNRSMKSSSKAKGISGYEDDNLFDFCREPKENPIHDDKGSICSMTNNVQKPRSTGRLGKATTTGVISVKETEKTSDTGTKQSKSEAKRVVTKSEEAVAPTMEEKFDYNNDFTSNNASNSHRALAVDTRLVLHDPSLEVEAGTRLFLRETAEFLKMCARKGYLPLYYACCCPQQSYQDNLTTEVTASTLPIRLLTGLTCPESSSPEQEVWNAMFAPITSTIQNSTGGSKSFKHRSTHDTWHLFVDFGASLQSSKHQ
jgi:hypothetical protein